MRRLLLGSLAVSLAATFALSVSLHIFPGASQASAPHSGGFVSQGSLVKGPALPDKTFPAYSQVVDNATPGRFRAPGWETDSSNPDGYGKDYRVVEPSQKAKPAQFKVKIPATDVYSVYAWWPEAGRNSIATRFGISTTSGVKWTVVNQKTEGKLWIKLGEYEMKAGERYAVQVSPRSKGQDRVVADAIVVVRGLASSPPDESYESSKSGDMLFSASSASGGRYTGHDLVRLARRHIGTPYRRSPPHPCKKYRKEDCACHTKVVFKAFGRWLPDNPKWQWNYGRWVKKSNLRPGDLVFFDENRNGKLEPWDHVGIFSGHHNVVHASLYFGKVVESEMRYIRGYWGAKRIRGG